MAELSSPPAAEQTLRLEGIHKSYGTGTKHETEVLHGIDLSLARGEFAALIGPSGSGKSTLLNIIGLLDKPSTGKLFLTGQEAQNQWMKVLKCHCESEGGTLPRIQLLPVARSYLSLTCLSDQPGKECMRTSCRFRRRIASSTAVIRFIP